jgi:hypothetical protein
MITVLHGRDKSERVGGDDTFYRTDDSGNRQVCTRDPLDKYKITCTAVTALSDNAAVRTQQEEPSFFELKTDGKWEFNTKDLD